MAGTVFFSVTVSLDGFVASAAVPVEDLFAREEAGRSEGAALDVAVGRTHQAAFPATVLPEEPLECLNAGLVDEFSVTLSPVLFGSGIRRFDGVDAGRVTLELVRAEPSPRG